ncbi:MAG: YhjD/YihY/BrkB family envelope integrity protein, partial [Candidatus Zixiibacteriota bacterium]
SLAAVFGVFYVLYRYIPSHITDRHTAMISALASTILWEVARQVFGFYISEFATLRRVYGAYIFFVVVALWIYYSSLVFIIGAEIGQLSRQRGKSRWARIRKYFAAKSYGPKR